MRGTEEYKNKYKIWTEKRIDENSDIEYLRDFYYFVKVKPKPTTVYNYIGYVINFLRYNNITDPSELRLINYTRYMAHVDTLKQSTQIAIYHALQKYSKFLVANKISDDYMEYIDRPEFYEDQETKEKRANSYLTEEEVKQIIKNIMISNKSEIWKQRDYTIVLLLLTSGVRCSALYKLDIDDIDFDNNSIVVTEKRDNVRQIILPVVTMIELEKWIKMRSSLGVDTSAVFISNQRTRMDSRSLYRVCNKYGDVDGKSVHPHMMRSTFGTTVWKKSGGDLFHTQQSMGHSNPKTTELYIRGEDDAIREKTANIMEDYVSFL